MDASSATSAVQRPGRGRVFDSIVEAFGDTPIVRLRRLPQENGVTATVQPDAIVHGYTVAAAWGAGILLAVVIPITVMINGGARRR